MKINTYLTGYGLYDKQQQRFIGEFITKKDARNVKKCLTRLSPHLKFMICPLYSTIKKERLSK
jgi:hypothetical protein